MADFKPAWTATGIGSLPMVEVASTVDLILENLPHVPFWPQLEKRSPWEEMIIQAAPGLPCLSVDLENREVFVDAKTDRIEALTRFYEAEMAGDHEPFALTMETAPGYFELSKRLAANPGEVVRPKGQVTGPVTMGLAVKDAEGRPIIHDPELCTACARGLGLKGAWQALNFPACSGPPIIFLDEPAMTGFGSAFMSVEPSQARELFNTAVEPIHNAGALAGMHICGNSDWAFVLSSDIDLVNMDAFGFGNEFVIYPKEIGAFLERGGIIAWGIAPTVAYTGSETPELLVERLNALLDALAKAGLDRNRIVEQSMLTPSCGMGSLTQDTSVAILNLLSSTSKLLRN